MAKKKTDEPKEYIKNILGRSAHHGHAAREHMPRRDERYRIPRDPGD